MGKQKNDEISILKAIKKTHLLGKPTSILFKVTTDSYNQQQNVLEYKKNMIEVKQWLRYLNLEKYVGKMESYGYNNMDQIRGFDKLSIYQMTKHIGCKEKETNKIYQNLSAPSIDNSLRFLSKNDVVEAKFGSLWKRGIIVEIPYNQYDYGIKFDDY